MGAVARAQRSLQLVQGKDAVTLQPRRKVRSQKAGFLGTFGI